MSFAGLDAGLTVMMTFARRTALLLGCVVASFLPGVFGSQFRPDAWYEQLAKSALTPPGWVFPIAWTTLYLAIGIAAFLFLVRAVPSRSRTLALALLAVQLVLNGAWSWLFFGCHRPDLALVDIGALWLVIAAMIVVIGRVRWIAGALLVPYLAWVSFASYLNFEIWRLN